MNAAVCLFVRHFARRLACRSAFISHRRFLVLPLVLLVFAVGAHAAPVLMISIDGLKPEGRGTGTGSGLPEGSPSPA